MFLSLHAFFSCCSVAQLCPTLCNPMDCSMPGFPVLHQSLLKLISTESVMPSNHLVLCPPLLLLPSIFPSIRVFSNESVLPIRWPKYWGFSAVLPVNIQGWFPLGLTGLTARDSQESSPTPQLESINSLVLSLAYSPTLISIHDDWKNHSFE